LTVAIATVLSFRRPAASPWWPEEGLARFAPVHTSPGDVAGQVAGQPASRPPRLTPILQFTFDVSVEPMLAEGGGEFARHLVFGPFHASSQVDYGDRASGE
jgi:hypothetical protein